MIRLKVLQTASKSRGRVMAVDFRGHPVVYDIPHHYANPVSGRTALPKIPSIDEQMAQMPIKRE
jgi:hypothetical protein